MARAGVYRTDVEKARRALLARGKNPSIDAVRAELGNTGSRSTIHRLLKEVEAQEGRPAGTKPAVSDALGDLVQRLAEQLHAEADARLAEHQAHFDAQRQTHAAQVDQLTQEIAQLRAKSQRTETTLAASQTALQETQAQLQDLRVQVAQRDERLAGLERRGQELEAHVESLEEKHRHARDALEHFRTAAQEQRAREQRQHEQALQALQVELRKAGDQLTAKQGELLQLNRDNARLVEHVSQLQTTLRTAERDRDSAARQRDELRPLPAQLAALETRAATAMAEAERTHELVAALEQRLAATRTELQTAELERTRALARLEGMEAALAHRVEPPAKSEAGGVTRKRCRDATPATGSLLEPDR
jgi:chromosome segregation ATPase